MLTGKVRDLDTLEECGLEGLSNGLPVFGSTLLEPQLDLGGDCILHQVPHTRGDDLCHLGDELGREPVLLLELTDHFFDVVVETADQLGGTGVVECQSEHIPIMANHTHSLQHLDINNNDTYSQSLALN